MITRRTLGALAMPALLSRPLAAAEPVRVAVGQKGAWDTSVCAFGDRMGFFQEAGLVLELLFTDGGTETQQAVVSGGTDAGVGAGMLAILGAAVRNAPVRILSSNFRGASDTFWYARAGSGIASFKDAGGKTFAYSTNGSSSNLVSLKLLQLAGVTTAKGVPTGNPVATLTQVMSGQIDIGYSLPPIAFPDLEAGRLVFVGSGREVAGVPGPDGAVPDLHAGLRGAAAGHGFAVPAGVSPHDRGDVCRGPGAGLVRRGGQRHPGAGGAGAGRVLPAGGDGAGGRRATWPSASSRRWS